MGYSGNLQKMQLTAYTDNTFTQSASTVTVLINPESYSRQYKILYNDTQSQGSSGGSPQYNKTIADQVKFQLVFDGTGVVPPSNPSTPVSVEDGIVDQITAFLNLAFTYDGEIHSPNYIQINWGTLAFNCRLCSLNMVYSLFKPDGTPLRAKADVSFTQYQAPQQIAQQQNAKSPDLTRVVTVQGGDTLPYLCYQYYGSSVYYAEVAKANNMAGFRQLIAGEKILFPPIGATA